MSVLAFIVGLTLAGAGALSLLASIDLTGTETGLLYAGCGIVALSGGAIVVAIGALIRRVDAMIAVLRERLPAQMAAPADVADAPHVAPQAVGDAAQAPAAAGAAEPREATAHGQATQVGRYSDGDSHYTVYSDGTLDAETPEGVFSFASMAAFKDYLASRGA